MPVKRKQDIPYQLLSWHEHVAFTRDKYPNLPYKEVLQEASATYKKEGGASAHTIAGKKRVVRRRAGLLSAHDIAGKKRVVRRRKPVSKRGAGTISDIANAVGAVSGLLGLGKARKPRAKRPAPKRAVKRRVVRRV